MTAMHLNDSKISAHQILASGCDVIVCSYEFVDANIRATDNYMDEIEKYTKKADPTIRKPSRPTAALASGLWALTGLRIKRGIMDECQVVNKRKGKRHQAIKRMPVDAWLSMSGTLPHNRWHDMSGPIDFLQGHPYTTDTLFWQQFSRKGYSASGQDSDLSGAQMALLQRFLQAVLVMRPRSVLHLPPCERLAFAVELTPDHAATVSELTAKYKAVSAMEDEGVAIGDKRSKDDAAALGCAIKAQMHSLHPRFADPDDEAAFNIDAEDLSNSTAEGLRAKYVVDALSAAELRKNWLKEVDEWTPDIFDESPHLTTMASLLNDIAKTSSGEKILVVSQYLKYHDILARLLYKRYGFRTLRYDGTVPQARRREVETTFADSKKSEILLMTAGAGSVGLNLTSARIVVICEEWWNSSVEFQTICRCWRQGQKEIVKVIKLHVMNSAIDGEISRVRRGKTKINEELMEPLFHRHDEIPKVVDLLY